MRMKELATTKSKENKATYFYLKVECRDSTEVNSELVREKRLFLERKRRRREREEKKARKVWRLKNKK